MNNTCLVSKWCDDNRFSYRCTLFIKVWFKVSREIITLVIASKRGECCSWRNLWKGLFRTQRNFHYLLILLMTVVKSLLISFIERYLKLQKSELSYKGLGTNLFLVYFSIPTQQLVTSFDSMIHSNIPQVSGFVPEEMIPSNRKTRHFKYGAKPGVPWNFFYYLANFSPFQRKVIFGRTWTWIRTAKTINDQKMKWNSKQKMY